jgi:hypothetical protein
MSEDWRNMSGAERWFKFLQVLGTEYLVIGIQVWPQFPSLARRVCVIGLGMPQSGVC